MNAEKKLTSAEQALIDQKKELAAEQRRIEEDIEKALLPFQEKLAAVKTKQSFLHTIMVNAGLEDLYPLEKARAAKKAKTES